MGYWTDRLEKKRARQAQERRIGYAQNARQTAIDDADHWRREAEHASATGQYDYAIECYQMVSAMNDMRAGAIHEIVQRRKAMGF
ncbi:hypothetical protein CH298_03570 [Rhodococcoides fascians]|uniref:hypothetical protein n=1 Tax=Rhodococcoides fascians TaxID=1828 RepID=UPI000B9AFC93|nr:hypothetical protein [Rhodococcus fascians]OZE92602.1 hypothetical protein CH303_03570 [Rhodococcus fascians]OZF23235.1 hypothetical protein CH298_03570 [Rhodococcus fascians]OZF24949.1 hypothetical protein CH297_03570 [Rhodococcus fascians]OZF72544.1 hypothetical protein CH308_03575 [Rhodococcus fascians]OZF73842.1 hypothetical protein CH307_03575 [Rhodococcus fascians]